MAVEAGQELPAATFKEMTSDGIRDVELSTLLAGKTIILFGPPGAYTPVCSTSHLPGFVAEAARLKAEGTAEIACISVNDPFVMSAWGEQHGAEGKVMMLSDPDAAFTRSIGMLGMALGVRRIRINHAGCMNVCEHGPTMVIYPDAVWYRCETQADIEEIMRSQVMDGVPVQRLLLNVDPSTLHG